ncbi:zinc finger protein ZAT9-like [Papaver somniferum]|uniref:zinc finger protein ZAT9-like n=1 Tax=Papaver somniferum TaxID=3469 RepID=UPI000E6FB1C9|nr:zinc finger protein ZAT9-like [Papaver somniferum]
MEEIQENNFFCKFCYKSFPCGRSLGGHMRSHIKKTKEYKILPSSSSSIVLDDGNRNGSTFMVETAEPSAGVYELRENPKKSWRLSDLSDDKALLGDEGEEDSWTTIDNEAAVPDHLLKKRKRTARYDSTTSSSSSFSLVNDYSNLEIEQEQEEVAICLMMLSRDVGYWGGLDSVVESSGNNFGFKKVESQDSVDGFYKKDDFKKLTKNHTKVVFKVFDDYVELGKYQCTTCNKIFHSYQALGGHKSRQTKLKSCFSSKIESSYETRMETEVSHHSTAAESEPTKPFILDIPVVKERKLSCIVKKGEKHECPICFKVFSSGQALGGHKRSHLVKTVEIQTTTIPQQQPEMNDLLNLYLPAPIEE